MEREQIKELVREVLGPNTPTVDHPQWVGLHCPFAQWKHSSGKDSTPSAGISVKDDDTSIFNCYTCGTRGPLSYFLKEVERYYGENLSHLIRTIDTDEFLGGSLADWGTRKHVATAAKFLDKATYLDLYDSAEGHRYLRERGISASTARTMQLMVDPSDSEGEERILFPVFNRVGELYGFTGRATNPDARLKVRDYHGLPKASVLLGEHLLTEDDSMVVVVEGLFDVARLVQYNVPVVGTLHAGLTEAQMGKLLDIGLPVYSMYDNDEAGFRATDNLIEKLGGQLPVMATAYRARARTPRSAKMYAKDPDTCTYEEVMWMLDHAKIV